MGELLSPSSAFDRLKDILLKLFPVFGAIVGVVIFKFVGLPLAGLFRKLIVDKLKFKVGTKGFFGSADFHEMLWWVPSGLIMGGLAIFAGNFIKGIGGDIGKAVGNFIMGLGFGFLIAGFLIPFAEDIPGLGFIK